MSTILDRTIGLKSKLESNQIELRQDSALCSKYIDGSIDLTLEQVVRRMCEMKYLYEYCNMKKIKLQLFKEYLKEKKALGKKLEKGELSLKAEKLALKLWSGGKYPNKFPWEKSNEIFTKFTMGGIIYLFFILIAPYIVYLYK